MHEHFLSRGIMAGKSGAAHRQPHGDEAVGDRCERLKIAAGRRWQHMGSLDQNVLGVSAVS